MMKTETLARCRNFAIALIAGVGLTAAAVYLAGLIAALPIPTLFERFHRDHAGVLIVAIDLVAALPLTLVAWAAGRLLFRALGGSSHQLWIAVGLPWFAYACMGLVEYIRSSGYEMSRAVSVVVSPLFLSGWIISVLCVPAGLWWASRYRPGGAARGT